MRKHSNSHREAKATAPVLDSTLYYAQNTRSQVNERYRLWVLKKSLRLAGEI